jgi:putative transposase
LAVVIDLFSRHVVGWAVAHHMRTELCVSALQMAYWRRKTKPDLLHHSDRGSQYASHQYRKHLAVMKMDQSTCAPEGMSRKGNCWEREACPWGITVRQNDSSVALNTNNPIMKDSEPKHQLN